MKNSGGKTSQFSV